MKMENEKKLFEKAIDVAMTNSENFDTRIIVILLDEYNLLFDYIERYQTQAIAIGSKVYNRENFFQFLEEKKTAKTLTN